MKKFSAVIVFLLFFGFNYPSLYSADEQVDGQVSTENKQSVQSSEEPINENQIKNETYSGGSILDIRITDLNNSASLITFDVDKSFVAEVRLLSLPYRLFVDMPMPYRWVVDPVNLEKLPVSLIQGFRYGNPRPGVLRVTMDLARNVKLNRVYISQVVDTSKKSYIATIKPLTSIYEFNIEVSDNYRKSLNSSLSYSNAIVFTKDKDTLTKITDITETYASASKKAQRTRALEAKIKDHLGEVSYPKPSITSPGRPIKVFIDPGHGGKDSGARSEDGSILEKDLVLKVAKMLKSELETNKDISVILSRDDDYYIPLSDRIIWAQSMDADLFVSIHADKTENNSTASGLSVYTLSEIASDAQTQLLANVENKSDIIAGINIDGNNSEVNQILLSLSQRAKSNESINLATNIVSQYSKVMKILENPMRSAGFVVLKLPNKPSILVELGFLSNYDDTNNFKNPEYIQKAAVALSAGIEYYLWKKGKLTSFPVAVTGKLNNYVLGNKASDIVMVP